MIIMAAVPSSHTDNDQGGPLLTHGDHCNCSTPSHTDEDQSYLPPAHTYDDQGHGGPFSHRWRS